MILTETTLKDAYIIDLKKIGDERSFFARAYFQNEFAEQNIELNWVQANQALSKKRGTFRGLALSKSALRRSKINALHSGRNV